MSTITPNVGLIKPDHSEASSIDVINVNFDAIDAAVGDIATVESSPTAAAHAVGEYLLYAGHMYRVTSAISAGSALILGTNVTPVKFGDELENANTAIKTLQDSVARINYINKPADTSCASWYNLGTGVTYFYANEYEGYGLPGSGLLVQFTQDSAGYTRYKNMAQMLFSGTAIYHRRIMSDAFTSWASIV